MIITQSPLRISLGGGGTDLPSYYENHGGFLITAAISKYVFTSINKPFKPGIYLKYSKNEQILNPNQIEHPIIREALIMCQDLFDGDIEITTLAEIPSGTGLGSSGSFTNSLLKALFAYGNRSISPVELAELSCEIEINKLNEPIGKQDQYISALGGIQCLHFNKDRSVKIEPLRLKIDKLKELEDSLLLFFTGYSRSASSILSDQNSRTIKQDKEMIQNLHFIKEMGLESREVLESGNFFAYGKLMHKHWLHKKNRSAGMSNANIDTWYQHALANGASGGKVVGAGGGGFLLFHATDPDQLRKAMSKFNLPEVRFNFDFEGTKLLLRN